MWWVILLSLLVAIGRFYVPGHDLSWPGTYEAMAHIWVGALLVYCLKDSSGPTTGPMIKTRVTAFICLCAITLVETVMFLLR